MECEKGIRGHKVADFLADKECKLVWNSSLGTGLGGGELHGGYFGFFQARIRFRWSAATRETRFL